MRDYKTASNEYKLGRLGRTPYDLEKWTNPALADYSAGKADRAKLLRKQGRKNDITDILAGIIAVFAVIGVIVAWALVTALPFLIVIGFLALLGVI